jgi:hypothetical protein
MGWRKKLVGGKKFRGGRVRVRVGIGNGPVTVTVTVTESFR